MTTSGEASQDPVTPLTGGFADQAGAIMLAFGVVTALLARERLGISQEVNASLLGAVMYLQHSSLSTLLLTGREFERRERAKASNPLWNWYLCKDGKYILMGLLQPDRYWAQLCRVLNIAHVEKDPRFINLESRRANSEELVRILDEIFATKTCHEWDEIFKREDLPHSPIQSLPDLLTDPQVLANRYIVDFHHPQLGPIQMCGLPVQFSRTPANMRLPAPEFGQHTEEVLLDHGYTWEQIEQLREEGAICIQ